MSVLQNAVYLAVPTVGLYAAIVLLVVVPRMSRRPRYRVGEPWPYQPMWWTANPEGAPRAALEQPGNTSGQRGGARGSW